MNLPPWLVSSLRDPQTKEQLTTSENGFLSPTGKKYVFVNGILSIAHPETLEGSDELMNSRYRWLAPFYDINERVLGRLITGEDMNKGRAEIVDRLRLKSGIKLLEVSPGPGVFQRLLRKSIGPSGELVSLDLSLPMLHQCRKIERETRAYLIHANGEHLPFADETFDAIFHFGGVNLFNEPQKAVAEFVRVVKRRGIVAYGDEGFAKGYPDGWRKRILSRMNPGFIKTRPAIPDGLSEVVEHTVYGGLGYLVVGTRK